MIEKWKTVENSLRMFSKQSAILLSCFNWMNQTLYSVTLFKSCCRYWFTLWGVYLTALTALRFPPSPSGPGP